ncbi:MAG: glycosyltransferase [Bifidobacteriaceae bacterium]|nr:glycosyltransferase [Bifidobacteriaceae bacterium]
MTRRHKAPLAVALAGAATFGLGVALPLINAQRRLPSRRQPRPLTSVDGRTIRVIIPAYLESKVIGQTVRRLRAQLSVHGPAGSSVLVVASDPATALAAAEGGASVISAPREGKPAAINEGIRACRGNVVVLTDGNAQITPDDWPALLLEDLRAASLVSGNKQQLGEQESGYWAYERMAKGAGRKDPLSDSIALIGEFVGFRVEDYEPIPKGTLVDDIVIGMSFDSRGLRSVVDRRITAAEEGVGMAQQFERRVRIAAGLLETCLPALPSLLATTNGRSLVFHKVYRQTLGALGYWVMAGSVCLVAPPWSAIFALAGVAASALPYLRPNAPVPKWVRALMEGAALQVVPPFAWLRVLKRWVLPASPGWKKVAR